MTAGKKERSWGNEVVNLKDHRKVTPQYRLLVESQLKELQKKMLNTRLRLELRQDAAKQFNRLQELITWESELAQRAEDAKCVEELEKKINRKKKTVSEQTGKTEGEKK
jgi:hypothetical protein